MYQEIIDIVKEIAGNDPLRFNDPIEVKSTPHQPPHRIYGVCVSPADGLYVDVSGEWYQLNDNITDSLIIASLYQRVAFIYNKKQTA